MNQFSVSFNEAIIAMRTDKKNIKCVIGDEEFIYKYNIMELLKCDTVLNKDFAISVSEILNGRWYILD